MTVRNRPTVKDHTPGVIRYFTYYLIFPDGEEWCDQTPFVHPLSHELKNTRFMKDPTIPHYVGDDLMRKGEADWRDNNGVRHVVKIEPMKRKKYRRAAK